MTTPAQYQHQLSELKPGTISLEGLAPDKAQEILEKLVETQQHIHEIDRAISLDMQVMRGRYQARYTAITAGSNNRVMESNKRRVGGHARQEELDHLNEERNSKLAPFEEVKKQAEEMLADTAVTRLALEKLVQAG